jgi:CRISPR-associated endonuclease Cas1
MHDHRNSPLTIPLRRGAVCVVEGYGVCVCIKRGHLVVKDGFGAARRERIFARATHGLSRLVILGHEGIVTLEAIRWLADLGIAFQQIDRDGRVLVTSANGTGDPRLRRQQALASRSDVGLKVARTILNAKLEGQRDVLGRVTDIADAFELFDYWWAALRGAGSLDDLLEAEREAALVYWRQWSAVECRFSAREAELVPAHWHRFERRHSPLARGARLAVNPINAILNYVYALLEAETRIACLIVGLDPGLGLVHADYRSRDSFVLDLMEAERPAVDGYVLDLVRSRAFRARDFGETRRGVCRVLAPLAHELAQTGHRWRHAIASHAEKIAELLATAPDSRIAELPKPLTSDRRVRAGAAGGAVRPPSPRPRPAIAALKPRPEPSPTCKRCGGPVPRRSRVYCDACLPHYQREQFADAFAGSGLRALRKERADGRDATHGGKAARKRGQSIAESKRAIREWEKEFGRVIDLGHFEREILPLIRELPLSRLVEATELSLKYCSQIRRGEKAPHPRHWAALVDAATQRSNSVPPRR